MEIKNKYGIPINPVGCKIIRSRKKYPSGKKRRKACFLFDFHPLGES